MKRPWNIINSPIYSLMTTSGEDVNMNICTYVTAISMKPKLYMIGIDYKTKTYDNLINSDFAILQILSSTQTSLVKTLGKKSGHTYNKTNYLKKKQVLSQWNQQSILKDSAAVLQLTKTANYHINGDHEIFIFKVEKSKTFQEQDILMFQDLIDQKIIL